jgi:F420-0:gamma-glutamyl ligase
MKMKYTWTTQYTLDITDEDFKEMVREAQRLERVDEFDEDEAVSAAVQDYIASLDDEIVYTITEKIIQEIEYEVIAYLNN